MDFMLCPFMIGSNQSFRNVFSKRYTLLCCRLAKRLTRAAKEILAYKQNSAEWKAYSWMNKAKLAKRATGKHSGRALNR